MEIRENERKYFMKTKHDVLLFTLETKSSKKLIPRVESFGVLSEALSSLMKTFHTEDNQS